MGRLVEEPFEDDPLLSDSPEIWDRLLRSIGPSSILVFISNRMGRALRSRFTTEDVWQETLLHVWRDRRKCEWRGIRQFRRWVLSIAEHSAAAKRGGGRLDLGLDPSNLDVPPPAHSTTPSQVAGQLEEAELMRQALESLPAELQGTVRLRLFEDLSVPDVARELELGDFAVTHRFRKGVTLYHARLQALLGER